MANTSNNERPLADHFIDSVDQPCVVMTPDGELLQWNEKVREVTGYSDEDLARMHAPDLVPEEERGFIEEQIQTALEEAPVTARIHYATRDGRKVPYEFTAALQQEAGRKVIVTTGREIEELDTPGQASRRIEERHHRLFEESQEGIAITTPAGQLIDANAAAEEIFGYRVEEVKQMHLRQLYAHPEERQEVLKVLTEEGAVRNLEAHFHRKDGKEIVCQLSSTALRGRDGEIEAFQTFFRDITEQKRAQEALETSEEKYRRLFEESRDAVILTTPEGDILDVNTSARELFGYSEEEFLTMDAGDLYAHPEERQQRIVPELLASESSSILEAEMRHEDGSTFLASASVTVHRGEDGTPELIQALVRDITRQRRLEEQLLEIQEKERRRIGQELHDGIASQLTGVTMIGEGLVSDLAQGKEVSKEDLNELTELVRESAQQTRLISRGLNPVQVGREGLSAALEKLVRNTERQSSLSCSLERPGSLPELEQETATHLYRIAQEAVTNAARHAEADRISIRLSSSEERLELSVLDDGKGIPEEFESFEGIGLHTMRYRADLIGGQLEIAGRPGEGTLVRCVLS